MSEYTIFFTTTASMPVTVEADNYDEAVEKAYDEMPSTDLYGNPFDLGDWLEDESGFYVDGEWRSNGE